MNRVLVYLAAFLALALGVASGATVFVNRATSGDAFCASYAICK